MRSVILSGAARIIVPLLLLFSLSLLVTGHSVPGGGFGGGLVAASALVFRSLVNDPSQADREAPMLRIAVAFGLLFIAASAAIPLFMGGALLDNISAGFPMPPELHPDVSLLFDTGVYLIACGGVVMVLETILDR